MSSPKSGSIWRLASGALVLVALAVAGCGSSGSSTSSTATQPTGTGTATSSSGSTSSGIPQGPNAGDRDADNSGGPSDGDGNL
jgi:hypothetical protein